jgi:outer membrane lipoprotein-sorting protein
MKKFFLFALIALLILSMSVIAFAEGEEEGSEEEAAAAITAEDLNASENPGVEFEIINPTTAASPSTFSLRKATW